MTEELYAQVVELDSLVQHALKRIENLEIQDVKGYVRIQDLEGKVEIVQNQNANLMRLTMEYRNMLQKLIRNNSIPQTRAD